MSKISVEVHVVCSDIITSFSTWWLQLFWRCEEFSHSMVHELKEIYYDKTEQVSLLNDFLDIRVPLC